MAGQREALLDAAYSAMLGGNWDGTRMADIAAAAGVSRQTLYNEFGSRDALARAIAERETARFLDRTKAAFLAAGDDLATALESTVAEALRLAADNPLVKAVLTAPNDSEVAPFLTTRADVILVAAGEQVTRNLRSRWPELDTGDVELVCDLLPRMILSHMMLPGGAPDVVARRLAAIVLRCLGRPAPGDLSLAPSQASSPPDPTPTPLQAGPGHLRPGEPVRRRRRNPPGTAADRKDAP